MDKFVQIVVNGVTLGSGYALIALGYSMVYGILKLLNFAHGDVYAVGAYIAYGVLVACGGAQNPSISIWLVLVLMTLAAMLGCAALGVTIERFAYRPLRNAPRIAPLISALGVSFFLSYSLQLLYGAQHYSYDSFSMAGGKLYFSGINWGPLHLPLLRIIVIVLAVVLMVVLTLLVNRTRIGKAMRATSFDREAASMMGIDVDRVIVFTFFIGSALAGAAGVMFALRADLFPTMGFNAGLKGFTAAVIGGIGSIPGAMLGGIVLGLAESFTQAYLSGRWSDLAVFAVLILMMIFRPQGLLGRKDISKV